MGRIGEELDIDFVVSTGDNFYDNGLKGEDDPNFLNSFSNIYTANSLQTQWFSGQLIFFFFILFSLKKRKKVTLFDKCFACSSGEP